MTSYITTPTWYAAVVVDEGVVNWFIAPILRLVTDCRRCCCPIDVRGLCRTGYLLNLGFVSPFVVHFFLTALTSVGWFALVSLGGYFLITSTANGAIH